uniref:Deoxyuridine 5'-triphosphate nucleotidohydrolase n=1 Tax=Henneguya salminicola TaxID=69463 RepID=A0A6G3MKC4_HENSL
MALKVKLLSFDSKLPQRGSEMCAGYDLFSSAECLIIARSRGVVSTGISIAVPSGTYGRVAPRSGLTVKQGLDVGAGVIDADYRGEVCVVLFNHSDENVKINKGDRVAQLILEKIETPEIINVQVI